MISRPTSPYPHNSFRQIAGGALAVILFLAVLVLAILVSYRYAHGWTQVEPRPFFQPQATALPVPFQSSV